MNKSITQDDFIRLFAKDLGDDFSQAKTKVVVNTLIDTLGKILQDKGEVSLHGFAKFSGKYKEAGTARNPKTGAILKVPAKVVPHVTFFTSFKNKVKEQEF